jgi:hypothetical protein
MPTDVAGAPRSQEAAPGAAAWVEMFARGWADPVDADSDRITLRDGKATERVAYLDAAPLLKAVARSPKSWPRFARTQLRGLRRRRR